MVIIISLWFVTAFLASFMAKNKGRNPTAWFFIAFFLLGVFSLLLLALLPKKEVKKQEIPLSGASEPSFPTNDEFEEFASNEAKEKIYRISTSKLLDWYMIDSKSLTRKGPLKYDAFRLLIREQEKPKETYVWNTELEDWMPLKIFVNFEILFDKDFD